jgi:23S rRNA-/tRNA-specific pseudouridylate synthase
MKRTFEVLISEHGIKLLPFLRKRWTGAHVPSVKALKRAIDGKRCRVNGRIETFSTYQLRKRDRVEIEVVEAQELKLKILFEDEFLIVCDKPAGLVCEPKNFPAKLVHRLDKETSGVLILAKKEPVRHQMIALFTKHRVKKEYVALVDGTVLKKEGKIATRLAKKHAYEGQTIYASALKGEEAITEWRCLGNGQKSAFLLCQPITGRTHQLRVHLKEIGHPILGDTQYAKKFVCPVQPHRHLLHAYRISFPHPLTGETVTVEAPLPEDFLEALEAVGMAHLVELLRREE